MPERDLEVITPERLASREAISAGFSLRHGGASQGPYTSLNVGLSTGDESESVLENRRRLFEHVGLDPESLAIAGQVHGDRILTVDRPGLYPGYDGLVTTTEGLSLCITAVDCAVVLLADADAGVIGACHSGWRGTKAEIAAKTVAAMKGLGASADRLYAYISPCISAAHFEVGPEVATQFDAPYVIAGPDPAKPHVDLKSAIADQLTACGLKSDRVDVSQRCTFAETSDFFSYRAEGTTGRMLGFICLHEAPMSEGSAVHPSQ